MTSAAARKRWRSEEGELRAQEVIECLATGGDIAGLGLERTESGLLDLRGLSLPIARIVERRELLGYLVESRETLQLEDVALEDLDLGDAVLDHLWLIGARVTNCRFDGARWRGGRVWRSEFETCSFAGASLRELGIAPEEDGRRTILRALDFSGADLRGLVCPSAVIEGCTFAGAKLDKVDFGGTRFSDTTFSGRLNDVIFRDRPWDDDRAEPNQMVDVDFSGAELCYVEFRGLSLERVTWPDSDVNPSFERFHCVLSGVVDALASDERPAARAVRAGFEQRLRWVSREQRAGTVHLEELEGLEEEVVPLMRRLESECRDAGDGSGKRSPRRWWR